MNKKIIIVVLVGIVIAAIIALMWWWFFNRPNNAPTPTGNFGTAQDRNGTSTGSGLTNIGSPTISKPTNAANKIPKGTYLIKSLQGNVLGSYVVDTNADGSFSFTPTNGSNPLTAGDYTLTVNGTTMGNFTLAPTGYQYAFALTPYTGLSNGTYVLKTLQGSTTGSFITTTNPDGSVTFTPTGGSGPLTAGDYVIGNDTYALSSNSNGTFNVNPYAGIPDGKYNLGTGTYVATTNPDGSVTFTPTGGSGPLTAGDYVIGNDTYALSSNGNGTFNVNPYNGTSDTNTYASADGGYWLSIPSIDTSTNAGYNATVYTTTGASTTGVSIPGYDATGYGYGSTTIGSVGIGGGISFKTASGTIFSSDNPFNSGTIPSIGSSGNPNGKGLGLEGALIGALATGVVACVLPALAKTIGGSFALAITGKSISTAGDTYAIGGAVKAEAAAKAGDYWEVGGVPVGGAAPTTGEAAAGTANSAAGTATANLGDTITGTGQTIAENLGLSIQLSDLITNDVLNCFARTVAHAALEQIARSTVAWINSGFKGSPSFVSNYQQFFTNVADAAAGQFLQSSALSFLCSPFSLQVKIAVAQSYARTTGQQCTLTRVVGNINNFMNGNFAAGGWPGFLSFTTQPTNNPYGAFAVGTVGIHTAAANAVDQHKFDLGLSGGFLSITQAQNCQNIAGGTAKPPPDVAPGKGVQTVTTKDNNGNVTGSQYQVCDMKNVTPGTAIAQSLNQTLGINTQSLEMAKYFDEIITALVAQLMQNIQSHGLANMSGGGSDGSGYYGGYVTASSTNTSGMIQQSVLQNIAPLLQSAQDVITYDTQNINNINATLAKASALQSCWSTLASAATSTTIQTQAQHNAAAITPYITDLNNRLSVYQTGITQANSSVASIQSAQTQAQSTTDTATLENILNSVVKNTQNQTFVQDTNVVNAQEDQINLSAALDEYNQIISTQMQACASSTTTFPPPVMVPTPITVGG